MGANAQTTVPDFVAETVLTAAKLDISAATGVPVFATTVTRDAAFGGANKVLAEGQTCYLEDANVVQYYDGAAWTSVGKVAQMVNTQTGALATGSTQMPFDDTIPQITEGNEYMTLAITPTSATNILIVDCVAMLAVDNVNIQISSALFQDSTAGALAAISVNSATHRSTVTLLRHKMTAGTTSATTFRFRAGPNSAQTITFNGVASARYFGGVAASSITITEYTP